MNQDFVLFFSATSPAIRKAFVDHPQLKELITSIDRLRGPTREDALQRALGVDPSQLRDYTGAMPAPVSEDVLALRELAEAVEAVIRGGKDDALGLDWTS